MIRRGLDTNVLLYAHIESLPNHQDVRDYLLSQLRDTSVQLILTADVLNEFIHVSTDGKRFSPPVEMKQAVATARLYLKHRNIICLGTEETALLRAFNLMDQHRLGRKRVSDTILAATLMTHGVQEIITCDPDDFRIFEPLGVIDPRTGTPSPVS